MQSPVTAYGGQLHPHPDTVSPVPGSVRITDPSLLTEPDAKISNASVAWMYVRKYAIAPGGSALMFGYSTSTGGSNVAPPGWNVHANGGAAPFGIGIGMSSWCTWLIESVTGLPLTGVPFASVIEFALILNFRPSMPAHVSSTSLCPSHTTAFVFSSGGRRTGVPRTFSVFGITVTSYESDGNETPLGSGPPLSRVAAVPST